VSRLDLVVGPNGAGKTTFVQRVIEPNWPGVAFVNADVIAAQRWPDDPAPHAYEAGEVAAATRDRLIDAGMPLIAETVFSHPSKLDLVATALGRGYFVALHALMIPEDLAVARVAARVVAGGHDVPEDKIRARYQRLWDLVAQAAAVAHTATFWDNSSRDGPRQVALLAAGYATGVTDWPDWGPPVLPARWP